MSYRLALGIGDILLSAAYYHFYQLNQTLVFNLKIIQIYRNGSKEYENFIRRLITDLFPADKVKYIFEEQLNLTYLFKIFPPLESYSLADRFNLIPVIEENYIVLFTKIRIDNNGLRGKVYSQLDNIIDNINRISIKKVILGERTIESNDETRCHNVISIYNRLDKKDCLDMTEETMTINSTYECFIRDLSIIHFANCCIGIGIGGNFCISLTFAQKGIFLSEAADTYPFFQKMDPDKFFCTSDIQKFISQIIS